MSLLTRLWRGLAALLPPVRATELDPEHLALRDWADLPPHHPLCDRAPC